MRTIEMANAGDREEVLRLYKMQLGREFCPWNEYYPEMDTIEFDLSRDALFVMREDGRIIAAFSIDLDEQVDELEFWTKELLPGGEISRLAVHPDFQNQGIARQMLRRAMEVLKERGFRSIHFLVNSTNQKALRSYAALGFSTVGSLWMYEQPMLCYEKAL